MHYTHTKLEITRGKIIRSQRMVDRQRALAEKMAEKEGAFADEAQALLLIMEQSLLSMTRFLMVVEKELAAEQGVATGRQKLQTRVPLRRHIKEPAEAAPADADPQE